MNLIIRHITAV